MKVTNTMVVALSVGLLALTAGCSKLEQANGGKGYAGKADTPAYSGNGGKFSANDFTPGDKTSWQEALTNRSKGQNEYNRTPPRDTVSNDK
ncbi:MAG TPA: hypothetical protein VFX23_13130 [Limnobacter sp.]|uniref:hypothetical protein n=1 Tax=Limnobacter sp. TaxID=2003368 RepID=UPI002E366C4C|nr:hypothetical protein [Limnobacter sp.]HEX5486928.1 hypothetical protein [Limnobacter sp.]